MKKDLTPREKKILWAGGVFIAGYLLFTLVVEPLYQHQKRVNQKIESRILLLNKYFAILNQKEHYKKKQLINHNIREELAQRFLSPAQPALAAANLQKILEGQARSSSVNIVQVKNEQAKSLDRLLTIPVRLTIRSNLRNLAQFLHQIENHGKFLVIEEMKVRRINKNEPEHLETRMVVEGFIQQQETEVPKKT